MAVTSSLTAVMHGTITEKYPSEIPPTAGDQPARDVLLSGLVIDAQGAAMVPSGTVHAGSAAARYYVSVTTAGSGTPERISASRLDASVIALLARIHLLADPQHHKELTTVLRRVVVLENAITLQLDKRASVAAWRKHEPMLQRLASADVLRLVATCLGKDEQISEAGTTLCLSVPRHSRARKIRTRRAQNTLLFRTVTPVEAPQPPLAIPLRVKRSRQR